MTSSSSSTDTSKIVADMDKAIAKTKIAGIIKSNRPDNVDSSSVHAEFAAQLTSLASGKVSGNKLDEMIDKKTGDEPSRDHAGRPVDEVGAPLTPDCRCNVCGRLLKSAAFYRKNKTYKSCNNCSEDRAAGLTREDIEKKYAQRPPAPVPVDVDPVFQAKVAKGELPPPPPQVEKQDLGTPADTMALIPVEKVNQYERALGLPATSADVWANKKLEEKITYQQKLAEMLALNWLKGRNPMTFLVLSMARAAEKSFPLLDTIYPTGISLEGYHDCLESRQKELEDVLNEIMKENPELITKYIANPWIKLAFILTMPAIETAAANYARKNVVGGGIPSAKK